MKKTDIYMPLFIGDYLKDTMHLTTQEHGAYLLAIMHYWATGPLPDDNHKLAAICRLDRRAFLRVRTAIEPFFTIAGGKWVHGRVEAELKKAANRREKAAESANARWNKQLGNDTEAMQTQCGRNANASPEHMRTQCSSTSTSSKEVSELYSANINTDAAREKIHSLAREIEDVVKAPPEFGFGLPSAIEMLFREGHTELEILDAARVIAAQGRPIKNFKYLVTTVRNRKADANRPIPPRKPRYNPADASSPESVAERRAKILDGMRATFPGFGSEGDGG